MVEDLISRAPTQPLNPIEVQRSLRAALSDARLRDKLLFRQAEMMIRELVLQRDVARKQARRYLHVIDRAAERRDWRVLREVLYETR